MLYPQETGGIYPTGVAWNGLSAVTESPSGAEPTPIYADDIKYLNLLSAEEFGATIEAYTYPDEFAQCDGSAEIATGVMIGQQNRKVFGLSYKTTLGNDVDGNDHGYKLHIIYGALAAPSEKGYSTINDSPEAITFSWEITTTPVSVTGFKPTASIVIDSTKVDAADLEALEEILYGTIDNDPYLPLPDEISSLFGGTVPDAIALSTIVPADDADNVAVDANVVLTFNNKILRESIVVTKSDGTIVAGTKSWDSTGKILTFDPTANLSNSSTYIVSIGGVVDIYGKTLAAQVKNFTTIV
ncbi:MAG: Ig-like domain-containing protein [Dysgonamonadaceae bacterium]